MELRGDPYKLQKGVIFGGLPPPHGDLPATGLTHVVDGRGGGSEGSCSCCRQIIVGRLLTFTTVPWSPNSYG